MTGFFQGIGNTKIPMWVSLAANLLNAVLAWVWVLGWNGHGGYGVAGAACATVVANLFSSLLYWFFFRRSSLGRSENDSLFPLDLAMLKKLTTLGVPIGAQMFFGITSFIVFCLFIGWLGDADLAANRIVLQMDQLAFMPIVGIGQAAQVIVGQYVGAGQPWIAKQLTRKAILLGTVFEVVLGLLYLGFAGPIVRFFSNDPAVIALGIPVMRFAIVWMAFDATFLISMSALRGAGDVRWPMMMNLLTSYGLRLPLVYWISFTWGYGFFGAWVGLTISLILLGLILYARFASGRWMRQLENPKNLVVEMETSIL